nr:ORF6N domain-containing protein [Fibrobacter sp. UWB5]
MAEIYGYSTKVFNQQVKNNIEKFDEDFRFQLNSEEIEELSRCKICTLNMESENIESSRSKFLTLNKGSRGSNIKYAPYAFTEQGVYMLMTVLKGERATAQSKALIRLFKQMKDYIIAENRNLLGYDGIAQIAVQTERNTKDIAAIQSDLQKVMENFVDPSTFKHFLILNGQKLDADVAYTQIYGMAKKSITIIDDYVGVKTLDLLRGIAKGVSVMIYSDENGYESLTEQIKKDFLKARPDVKFDNKKTKEKFHDRYIFLDYGLRGEKLFHCGASSKDAGNKITTIMQIENTEIYHVLMEKRDAT